MIKKQGVGFITRENPLCGDECISSVIKEEYPELEEKIKRIAKSMAKRYADRIFNWEDIGQEMLFKLWKLCREGDPKLKTANQYFILLILKYVARDRLYRRGKSIEKHTNMLSLNDKFDDDGRELEEMIPAYEELSPQNLASFRLLEEEIRSRLSKKQGVIFDLILEGYNQVEISEKLKESHQNINYHLKKIRKHVHLVIFSVKR